MCIHRISTVGYRVVNVNGACNRSDNDGCSRTMPLGILVVSSLPRSYSTYNRDTDTVRKLITTGRDMSVVALSRDSPASRAPPPSHPTLATLSRPLPSRVRSLVEDLLGWPSQCHLHPFAVRSLPRVLYHTRGGGGSCAISTTPAGVGAPESPARA